MITAAGLSRAALTEKPYRWRDPARNSPARLAALADHDAKFADRASAAPGVFRGDQDASHRQQAAQRDARRARYAAIRAQGTSLAEAAIQVGVSRGTARKYENAIRAQAEAQAAQ